MEITFSNKKVSEQEATGQENSGFLKGLVELWRDVLRLKFKWPIRFF